MSAKKNDPWLWDTGHGAGRLGRRSDSELDQDQMDDEKWPIKGHEICIITQRRRRPGYERHLSRGDLMACLKNVY
ncbi:unnamed protein product [Heligmosomoides polygyrus]|uniref:Uncharacterized protein n=1 Tax=Heligmosomoides polygyrus TaxID=6339 RepID=A0A183FLK3_HELPZ|nr:unnamed protein product [Heligmosomoides polygyrus]